MSPGRVIWGAFGVASAAVLATRLPHESIGWTVLLLGLTGGIAYALRGLPPRSEQDSVQRSMLAAATIVWLLVPPSPIALASFLPNVVVALCVLAFLHTVYGTQGTDAPRLEDTTSRTLPGRAVFRMGTVLFLVILVNELWPVLPATLGALYEMDKGLGPLVAAGIVLVPVALWVGVRTLWQQRTQRG